jgi:glycosyltransferase involved in cell wall biosynthesis
MSRRICFVTTELRGLTAGGIGASVVSLGRELGEAGWDVTFLVAGPAAELLASGHADVAEARSIGNVIGTEDARFADVARPVPDWAFGLDLAAIADRVARVVESLCLEQPFDVVEFPDYQGLAAAAVRRRDVLGGPLQRPTIAVRLHGTLEVCMEHEMLPMRTHRHRCMFALERAALSAADVLVAASDDLAGWYADRYQLSRDRFVVSPLPFESVVPERLSPQPGHVVFVGKVQRLKGVDRLVDAAIMLLGRSEHADLRFSIAGSDTLDARTGGSLQAALERRIPPRLRDRISFLGPLDGAALRRLVGEADAVVLPNRIETYCLVAYELLSVGTPAVLSGIAAFDVVERERNRLGLTTVRFVGEAPELASAIAAAVGGSRPTSPVDVSHLDRRSVGAYEQLNRRPTSDEAVHVHRASTPLVSVIVPYYEMQEYVADTVRSILRSTYTSIEVVVVDDGSPSDEAQACLDALPSLLDDDRVRVVRKANGGLGSARNHGIAASTGEYVLPVDSDDLIAPSMIETLVGALERMPQLDAMACYAAFFEDPQTLAPVDYVVPYELDPVLIALENRAGVASTMFRRSVFDDLAYDVHVWAFEDWSLWWSFAACGRRAGVVPEVLFHYRRRPASMVKELTVDSWARLLEHVADRHADHIRRSGVDIYGVVMAAFVEARAELHALRRLTPPTTDYSLPRALHREAVALRTSRSARLAAAARRGLARVKHPRRPATFEVRVIVRPSAAGVAEAWSLGVRELGSSVVVPVRGTGWVDRQINHPIVREAAVASAPDAELRWRAGVGTITWSFLGHPYSSAVEVVAAERVSHVDLRRDLVTVVEIAVDRSGDVSVGDVAFEADDVHLDG